MDAHHDPYTEPLFDRCPVPGDDDPGSGQCVRHARRHVSGCESAGSGGGDVLLRHGAGAIETNIMYHLERQFTVASGIDHMESRSLPGVSLIRLYFRPGTDPDAATISSLA